MLKLFQKKQKDNFLYAPVEGEIIALENVQDAVFSSGMMGQGLAFRFTGDTIYAPSDGTIVVVAPTKHAVGIQTPSGLEILLHIGMDTVNLQGKGFTLLKDVGDKVKAGMPILKIDREVMNEHGIDLTTPMIVTNSNGKELVIVKEKPVMKQDVVISIIEKRGWIKWRSSKKSITM